MTRPVVVNLRRQEYDVYIGRGSKWGNPFSHLPRSEAPWKASDRPDAIRRYADWIPTQPNLMAALSELAGKRLGCYCAPLPCHGDVLAGLVAALE
jgi:hypothetical protein